MNFKCCTFENVALILAVVHVLLGRGLQNKGEVAGVVLLYASYVSCCNSKMVKIGVAYIYGSCILVNCPSLNYIVVAGVGQ